MKSIPGKGKNKKKGGGVVESRVEAEYVQWLGNRKHIIKKKSGLELLDKEELLEACKQETSLIKFPITKITQVGVHKTNWRLRVHSGKSVERYCAHFTFKGETEKTS